MSTIDPSQLTAADMSNPALSAQDLADITAARPDLRPYVATHPSLYPALGQWLADQGVVPAQPPAAAEPLVSESEAPAEEAGEQAEPVAGAHEEAQTEPPTGDEATPAPSTEEQVAQAPFGQPQYGTAPQQGQPQFGGQPQQGQQVPFGQQQYGQPGYAPVGQSAGQQFGAAAQQFGAAANSAFNQFQTAVVAETGKVSGRSVRATYSLIGIAASAVLVFVSMLLPYLSSDYGSASMFTVKGGYSAFHLIMLMAVVGLGVAYWFTNQKWAYLSAGIGALVVALLGVVQFFVAVSYDYVDAGFGAYMLALFSIALGVAGGFLLMELKTGAVAPINNPNAFGGAFAGVQMGQQQGGFPAPQAGQPQYGQQAQFGQQQGQQPQPGDKPYNPFGPQA